MKKDEKGRKRQKKAGKGYQVRKVRHFGTG
jgi:hypothetical protein